MVYVCCCWNKDETCCGPIIMLVIMVPWYITNINLSSPKPGHPMGSDSHV